MINRFWSWYEKNYKLNLVFSTGLFLLQLFHLYWMAAHILGIFFFGHSFFIFPQNLGWLYAIVDYTEIPALISVSLIYINRLRKKAGLKWTAKFKDWLYLGFLNIQWVHLFWITDEVVLQHFQGTAPVPIPRIVALGAILIDFLELPVMIETTINAVKTILSQKEKGN